MDPQIVVGFVVGEKYSALLRAKQTGAKEPRIENESELERLEESVFERNRPIVIPLSGSAHTKINHGFTDCTDRRACHFAENFESRDPCHPWSHFSHLGKLDVRLYRFTVPKDRGTAPAAQRIDVEVDEIDLRVPPRPEARVEYSVSENSSDWR
jgi:hypothetical protein